MNKEVHTAIFCQTESGDSYLFCSDEELDEKGVKKYLKKQMPEEHKYICVSTFVHTNGNSNQW